MATLVFATLGTIVAGPLGGAIGAMAGEQVDNSLFGGSVQGPRLNDLTVTTSSYGSGIPRHFGRMRVAGSIIWATDLVEHKNSQGGKMSPSVTTYSYTVSFAVALSSRALASVGRIWADGYLLRGAAGDMKVSGTMRFYDGSHAQPQDSVIASAEGASLCPAFRGISYVVFEDLDLSNFGNRIPALTFEVFADSGALTLEPLFDGLPQAVNAAVALPGVDGYACEGTYKATLEKFQTVFPMSCDADGTALNLYAQNGGGAIALAEAAVSGAAEDFGGKTGFVRKRMPAPDNPPLVLRYYDVDLDYQPGSQRAFGQALAGQPKTLQLPAALDAADAFALVTQAAHNADWARETIQWRTCELDPAVVPGTLVTVPDVAGTWRVTEWEWRTTGVELTLERMAPVAATGGIATSAGAGNVAADLAVGTTELVAFELPYQGVTTATTPQVFAAAASAGAGWAGATLYTDDGSGALDAVGATGRLQCTMGVATSVLAAASPMMFDRVGSVTVQLAAPGMALTDATADQLIGGANTALLGGELIQFGSAVALGGGVWRLSGLLRGRGATEAAVGSHVLGEAFVLLNGVPTAVTLPAGLPAGIEVAAIGLADAAPVVAPIVNAGISLTPVAPVAATATVLGDGSVALSWIRRARGMWRWTDGVDVPLVEESESYVVGFGALTAPVAGWTVAAPGLTIAAADVATLRAQPAGTQFWIRQAGTYALSAPTWVAMPA